MLGYIEHIYSPLSPSISDHLHRGIFVYILPDKILTMWIVWYSLSSIYLTQDTMAFKFHGYSQIIDDVILHQQGNEEW